MATQPPLLHALRACVAAAALGLAAAPAFPQMPADVPDDVLRVEVTGTHILRAATEDALPVQVITREDIERSGATTVSALVSTISANVLGFNDQRSIGSQLDPMPRPGQSTINLRGLGDGNTLVLVNGRRVANYAFDGSAVDVNAIPVAAIDRVEVLRDGASAIYGTDAIAGVLNFILRKDFRGVEASATGAWAAQGGGQAQAVVTAGAGDLGKDGFNAFATLEYQKDQTLRAADRAFARTGFLRDGWFSVRPETFPANVQLDAGGLVNPSRAAGCAPPTSLPATISGSDTCWFDPGSLADLIPQVTRKQAVGRATLRLDPAWQLFAEGMWAANDLQLAIAPTPAWQRFLIGQQPLLYPVGGPFYPSAFAAANGLTGDLDLAYRTIALGNRVDDVDTRAARAVVGIDGSHAGWDLGGAIVYSANRQTDRFANGYVSQQRLVDAMATGFINPFGPSAPQGDALLAGTEVRGDYHHASGSTWLMDARASGELLRLPGGPLAFAVGGERRREALDNAYADTAQGGDVIGTGSVDHPSTRGRRDVWAAYAEAGVPLAQRIEAQLAVRYDHYDDFGGTTNPKLALRWQAARNLLLRASWGTGFRAPALYDLYTPPQHGFTSPDLRDPVRCPVTGLPSDCLGGFPAVFGGNPALQPEKSEQVNAGVVFEPVRGLSVTVDYWRVRKDHLIAALPEDQVLLLPGSPWAATNIVRGAVDARYPNVPGPIESVILVNENVGDERTSGVDAGVQWHGAATKAGRFTFALDGTWVQAYRQRGVDGTTRWFAGNNDGPGPLPRWRHHASLNWSYARWSATLAQTFQSSYTEVDARYCDDSGCPVRRRVASYDVFDVQVRYAAGKATIAAGVKNVLDRDPPFTNLPSGYAGWYDAAYADPRGRTGYVSLTYDFR